MGLPALAASIDPGRGASRPASTRSPRRARSAAWIVHAYANDAVHSSGSAAANPRGFGFPPGGLDWEEYLGALEEIGYRGFLTIWPDVRPPRRRSVQRDLPAPRSAQLTASSRAEVALFRLRPNGARLNSQGLRAPGLRAPGPKLTAHWRAEVAFFLLRPNGRGSIARGFEPLDFEPVDLSLFVHSLFVRPIRARPSPLPKRAQQQFVRPRPVGQKAALGAGRTSVAAGCLSCRAVARYGNTSRPLPRSLHRAGRSGCQPPTVLDSRIPGEEVPGNVRVQFAPASSSSQDTRGSWHRFVRVIQDPSVDAVSRNQGRRFARNRADRPHSRRGRRATP